MASASEKPGPSAGLGSRPGPGPGVNDDNDHPGNDRHLTLPTTNSPPTQHRQTQDTVRTGLRIRDWVRSPRSGEARHHHHRPGTGGGLLGHGSTPAEPEPDPTSRKKRSAATRGVADADPWWKIHLFRGMVNDVRKRAPYYWSDWTDAWNYRVVPATVYMFFAK